MKLESRISGPLVLSIPQKGFTMVELMVVLVIVAILAAVAVPLYTGYIHKAKAEEAKACIGALVTAEKVYKQRNGVFTANINDLNVDTAEAPCFDFVIDNVSEGDTFGITATVNVTGEANGLPDGGTVIYSYDINDNPRGSWSGSLY